FFITQNDINHLTQQMVEFINSQQDAADAGGVN
ncbi:putative inner membrane lipoprotein, partial [Salmonella enterica subsp. enterica serovar Enteritidis str. 13183-1]